MAVFYVMFLAIPVALASNQLLNENDEISRYENRFSHFKPRGLNPEVWELAQRAYIKANAQGLSHNPLLTVIDYSKPSTQPRLWVIDPAKKRLVLRDWVSHGRNSEGQESLFADYFSNQPQSRASSLGVFVTGQTYKGKHGLSLRLKGLEKDFNANAEKRDIVMHAAAYVSRKFIRKAGRLGCSYGCLAVSPSIRNKLINDLKDGSVVFAYYPDKNWLAKSTFLNY